MAHDDEYDFYKSVNAVTYLIRKTLDVFVHFSVVVYVLQNPLRMYSFGLFYVQITQCILR